MTPDGDAGQDQTLSPFSPSHSAILTPPLALSLENTEFTILCGHLAECPCVGVSNLQDVELHVWEINQMLLHLVIWVLKNWKYINVPGNHIALKSCIF